MNIAELKEIWKQEEKTAHIHGWDFSRLNGRYISNEDELCWDYEEIVKSYLSPDMKLLDIDTGGGELLVSFKHPYSMTSATEAYPPNVELCSKMLLPLGIDFREYHNCCNLPFDDCTFNIVINRHGAYDLNEVKRILKNGGIFITQQVGEKNNSELVEMLCPNCKPKFKDWNLSSQTESFRRSGFNILKSDECFQKSVFYDIEAVIWYARVIEWEFIDFSVENNFEQLLALHKIIEEQGRIESTIHRFLVVARK